MEMQRSNKIKNINVELDQWNWIYERKSKSKLFNYNQYGLKIDDLLTTGLFYSIEFLRKNNVFINQSDFV